MDPTKSLVATLPVLIVADDLIWSSRLRAAADRAGTTSVVVHSGNQLIPALAEAHADTPVIVDLNGRTYDGVDAVRAATAAGHRVIAVGQHEDLELRRRALGAGARRVFSYNKLFSDGPNVLAALLADRL